MGAVMLLLLPSLVSNWGLAGLVGGLAGAAILLSALAVRMPAGSGSAEADESKVAKREASESLAIWLALLAVLVFMASGTMAWAFLERLANDAAYSAGAVANVLSASLVFAVLGSLVAAVVESRFGLSRPMAFAVRDASRSSAFAGFIEFNSGLYGCHLRIDLRIWDGDTVHRYHSGDFRSGWPIRCINRAGYRRC